MLSSPFKLRRHALTVGHSLHVVFGFTKVRDRGLAKSQGMTPIGLATRPQFTDIPLDCYRLHLLVANSGIARRLL